MPCTLPSPSACRKEAGLRREARPRGLPWAESEVPFSHLWPVSSPAHVPSGVGGWSFLSPGNRSPMDLEDCLPVHPLQLSQEDPEKQPTPVGRPSQPSQPQLPSSPSLKGECSEWCDSGSLVGEDGRWAPQLESASLGPSPALLLYRCCLWRDSNHIDRPSLTSLSLCPQSRPRAEGETCPCPQGGAWQPGGLPRGHWLAEGGAPWTLATSGPWVTGSHFLPYLPLQLPGQTQASGRSVPRWRGTAQTKAAPK